MSVANASLLFMTPTEAVAAYWERMQARDWQGLRQVLADDVVVDWPASGERFVGGDNVVAVNREYPEGWSIRVLSILASADRVASEVEVPMEGGSTHRVASFWTIQDERIVAGVEYWVELGADEPGTERAHLSEPMP